FTTGNGGDNGGAYIQGKLGESVVKLSTVGHSLKQVDFFTPFNQQCLDTCDLDLSTAEVVLVPGTTTAVAGGKEGRMYLLDTNNLGQFHSGGDQVLQCFKATEDQYVQGAARNQRCEGFVCNGTHPWVPTVNSFPHLHGSPVALTLTPQQTYLVYIWAERDRLKAFKYDNGACHDPANATLNCGQPGNATPTDQAPEIAPQNTMPGGVLSLSGNSSLPAATGIVWASHPLDDGNAEDARAQIPTGVLTAYEASNLKNVIWDSRQPPQDQFPPHAYAKFCPPTIANGRVYMATFAGKVAVFGLRPEK